MKKQSMSDSSKFEEFPKLTFSELKHLDGADVAVCVNHAEAIQICKLSIEVDDVPATDIQKLWLTKLLKAYNAVEFTYSHWQDVISFLNELYKKLLESVAKDLPKLGEINTWLADCFQFLQWFEPLAGSLDVACTCIVVGYPLNTVIGALQAYNQWSSSTDLKEHVEYLLSIQNFVLKILNGNMERWQIDTAAEFASVTDVIALLCTVGEQSAPLIMKTIVETWKTIAKLSTFCVKNERVDVKERRHQWVQRPMLFLINEVKRNMTIIFKEESLKKSVEQIEKFLRVTNFYLQLLRRLSLDFQHADFPIIEDYWLALEQSKSVPNYLANSAVAELIQKYVSSALQSMLSNVYKHSAVEGLLVGAAKKDAVWLAMLQDYLFAVVADKDVEYVNTHTTHFVALFNDIWTAETNFIDASKYNMVIELYAALAVLSPKASLTHALLACVMKAGFPAGVACCDVLIVAASTTNLHGTVAELIVRKLRFMLAKFSLCTRNKKALLLAYMLRYCDELGVGKQLQPSSMETSALQLRIALGIPIHGDQLYHHLAFTKALIERLNLGECAVPDYYRLVASMRILAASSFSDVPKTQLLFDSLYTLARKITAFPADMAKHFAALLAAIFIIAQRILCTLSAPYVLKLLQLLQQRHKLCFSLATVASVQLLSACRKSIDVIIKEIVEQIVVAASAQNQLVGRLMSISHQLPQHSLQLSLKMEYLHLYKFSNATQQHVCADMPALKRPRLCSPEQQQCSHAKLMLRELLVNTLQLKYATYTYDEADRITVKSIINNLNSILASKF